jgi:hypothetical protein
MIYVSGTDVYDMMNTINDDLNNIYKYLCNHKLSVNENKCKFIIIKSKYNVSASIIFCTSDVFVQVPTTRNKQFPLAAVFSGTFFCRSVYEVTGP